MTTLYVDVSHHDVDRLGGQPDWPRVREVTSELMCARATYGDPQGYAPMTRHFANLQAGARAAGFTVRGGYHNLIRGDQAGINRQVDWFRAELDAAECSWAMLDAEPYDALVDNDLWPRLDDVQRFCDRWRAVESRALLVYLARWFWSGWLGGPDLRPLGCPVVASNYAGGGTDPATLYAQRGGDAGVGWAEYGGVVPAGWQFSSSCAVPGLSDRTDVNAIRDPDVLRLLTGGNVTWYLNRALTTMRAEVDDRYPSRDKTSDGTIGDAAHASRSSDHNPDPDGSVDAWDMDSDLRSSNDPAAWEFLKGRFQAHPASSYWIHRDIICRRADNWARRSYPDYLASKGIDPSARNTHYHHVHWNSREEYEGSSQPWGIEVNDVELTDKLSNGSTLDGILVTIYNRTDYLANKLGLSQRLDQILAAAVDDGSTTVTMSPEDRAALVEDLVGVLHVPDVEEIGAVVDRELDEQSRAGADTDT